MAVLPWSHLLSFSGLSSPYCVTAPECSNPPDGAGQTHTDSLTYIHKDTHTRTQTHTVTGRFTHFLFNGWHRSTCLVTYTEMIMSFLAICLSPAFLLVGNVAVKSCLAVIQLMSCLQTVQMKMFHSSFLIFAHIVSWSVIHVQIFLPKIGGRLTEQMHVLCFIWQLRSSKELCPKKQNTIWKSLFWRWNTLWFLSLT